MTDIFIHGERHRFVPHSGVAIFSGGIVDLRIGGLTLGVTGPRYRPPLTVARIQQTVADYYRLSPDLMRSRVRDWHVSHPRQVAMYLSKKLTRKSLSDIGRRFGNKHHTTVIHAVREVTKRISEDKKIAEDVHVLRGSLAA